MLSGEVYKMSECVLGSWTCTDGVYFRTVTITVDSEVMIQFPLANNTPNDEVPIRIGNICNQTGLVTPPVRVTTNS